MSSKRVLVTVNEFEAWAHTQDPEAVVEVGHGEDRAEVTGLFETRDGEGVYVTLSGLDEGLSCGEVLRALRAVPDRLGGDTPLLAHAGGEMFEVCAGADGFELQSVPSP